MPASDGLQPQLSAEERAIVKSYGGWTAFCIAFGLKPWNSDENDEAKAIVQQLARNDDDEQ
ncbi:uncharacterized protein LOC62_01G000090 [Vanrija pseudolonga]|uniref:Uncharacterized protein n=1 Tax=Vanrija pseudolonga TaxID=143232 RepID=A0AAF1BHY4_9TREE|nr:hypothetical protein LOC62_01G000090 [Vanrija pseudolonga]